MSKGVITCLNTLLYYFTPLYKGGSKVVEKQQHHTTLKAIKVVIKVVKVVRVCG
jgi:hypothetical protein